ncbi:NEP1-interacting protein-like 1 isoform X1 [Primulina tabacum]|uniref:NEP1-interacting protein-like 1 isoform X1 n=1 Tax=Primulina tabacum TaxID=48773 RepID=UPI003F5A3E54
MLMCCLQMKRWLSAIFSCSSIELASRSESGLVSRLISKIATILSACIFALGGAMIGSIAGALKGHTTEAGMLRGVGVGAVAGAITGVQLMELIINGEPFSKVALICSLLNGKIFREWVSNSVLEAYQWQISNMESSNLIVDDIFEVSTSMGLPKEVIKELPIIEFFDSNKAESRSRNCAVCFQDVMDGERARLLPSCRHLFHIHCIDQWLARRPTCPLCRQLVGSQSAINIASIN